MDNQYAIGIDVGGSSLKCGLIHRSGDIRHSLRVSLEHAANEADVILLMQKAILQCAGLSDGPVLGVGIGFPGIIENGIVIGGGINLPGFHELPLASVLSGLVAMPVHMDNDANMMALGELAYGSAQHCGDVIFLTVGTGIGGAILVDKKILGGYRNRGGELGHIIIQKDGESCACGAKGCFEAYASTRALVSRYKNARADGQPVNGELIVQRYADGDPLAVKAMEAHFDYMATGVASLVNIFSPQCVVIGGGISEAGEFYINAITARVKQMVIPAAMQHTQIVAAGLGNKAGMLGCAARVFESMHSFN